MTEHQLCGSQTHTLFCLPLLCGAECLGVVDDGTEDGGEVPPFHTISGLRPSGFSSVVEEEEGTGTRTRRTINNWSKWSNPSTDGQTSDANDAARRAQIEKHKKVTIILSHKHEKEIEKVFVNLLRVLHTSTTRLLERKPPLPSTNKRWLLVN
jgi:hypothetical protein